VIARSFERIHRANLVAMGVLPVQIDVDPGLAPADRIAFTIDPEQFAPLAPLPLKILRADGRSDDHLAATLLITTAQEAAILRAGGVIPLMLERALGLAAQPVLARTQS
jgi:aconitate hydratase A / 2-methylisocitrate dehydratase